MEQSQILSVLAKITELVGGQRPPKASAIGAALLFLYNVCKTPDGKFVDEPHIIESTNDGNINFYWSYNYPQKCNVNVYIGSLPSVEVTINDEFKDFAFLKDSRRFTDAVLTVRWAIQGKRTK